MDCPRCGSAITPGQKFCAECGLALGQHCPNCGAPFSGEPKFCAECGTPLAAVTTAATPVKAPAETPTAERRLVSVLFADLVGFTQLSEQQDPEAVRDLLSRYFETARAAIEGYGGTVEKFIGDAVMAVWGAPTAHEDDAERAVRAALELVQAVSELSIGGSPLALRAGVLSGEAAVSAGRQGEGLVAGDVVNTASRLQSVAPPGVVLVGEQTRQQTSAAIAYEPAGEQLLKGKQAPVAAWRALRVVARVGGEGRDEALEPPFVGRQLEMRLLKDQLHAVEEDGRLRVVSITGQAGLGKSRLAWELEKYLDGLAGTVYYWHQGRSPSYGEGVTFWALGEMVRRRARIAEGEPPESTREKLRATLADFVPDADERRRLEPALGALLGIDDVDWDAREQLFSAWRTFFERITDRGPVVLVFEDLHWADSGLLDFIEHLIDWARERPMLIVTLARPELLERRPDFGAGRSAFVALHLEPLSDAAMGELLRGLVPQLPDNDLARIVARAEGVPLYAVETVGSLVDGGHLRRAGDAYELAGDLPALDVPPTLRALIASRLDALEPADRSLLQDASVIGLSFAVPALAGVTQRDPAEVEAQLRRLAQKEFVSLETDPRSPERGQYRLRQELVREVAYGMLAKRERRARHLAAARHFETVGDDELAGVLANHYLEAYRAAPEGEEGAAVAAQARLALRAAAERASRLHSHQQALAYYEQALAVTFDEADRTELLVAAARSARSAGQLEKAEGNLREALAWYQAQGDKLNTAETALALSHVLIFASRIDQAIELLSTTIADAPPDAVALGVRLNGELGRALLFKGDGERALASVSTALDAAEREGLPTLQLMISKSWALSVVGNEMEGAALLIGVAQLADDEDDLGARLRSRFNLSAFILVHDPHAALRIGLEGLSLAERYGESLTAANMAANAASAALTIGDLDQVVALETNITDIRAPLSTYVHAVAGAAHAFRGDFEAAQRGLAQVQQQVEASSSDQDLVSLRYLEALVAFAEGRLRDARELAIDAIAINPNFTDAVGAGILTCRVALLLGDLPGLLAKFEWVRWRGRQGKWIRRVVRSFEAGALALEGRTAEALTEYRTVLDEWRTARLPMDLALTLIERAWLLGDVDSEAAAGLDEARQVLAEMGAEGLLDRLAAGSGRVQAVPAAELSGA